MTPRLWPLFVVIAAGCADDQARPPARSADLAVPLAVPPLPDAGTPAPPPKKSEPLEEKLSYEAAIARANADGPVATDEADMTDGELSMPMRNAVFISGCGAPDDMKVIVKVAVQRGRAVGVTIATVPQNDAVARCVDDHVRRLRWPVKQKLDSFTSTY